MKSMKDIKCDECFWRMDKIISRCGDLVEPWFSEVKKQIHLIHQERDKKHGE